MCLLMLVARKLSVTHFVLAADYLKVIERMKQVIKMAGKKVLLIQNVIIIIVNNSPDKITLANINF